MGSVEVIKSGNHLELLPRALIEVLKTIELFFVSPPTT